MANPRITPYQTDLLVDARNLAGLDGRKVIDSRNLRSKTASQHLVAKGYMVDVDPIIGPRGGVFRQFVLTDLGRFAAERAIARRRERTLAIRAQNEAYAARKRDAVSGGEA